jgi:hypothetical protein
VRTRSRKVKHVVRRVVKTSKKLKRFSGKALAIRKSPEPPKLSDKLEQALIMGNLIDLQPAERVQLYMATCKSLGLNPLTRPFDYILFQESEGAPERLELYATRKATDQLRKIHGVSIVGPLKRWTDNGMLKAEATVSDRSGRTDSALGVIVLKRWSKKNREWYTLSGAALANAEMHVETKAKRRATLSLCGLGMLDETELDNLRLLGGVTAEGRIFRYPEPRGIDMPEAVSLEAAAAKYDENNPALKRFEERAGELAKPATHEHGPKEGPKQPEPAASTGKSQPPTTGGPPAAGSAPPPKQTAQTKTPANAAVPANSGTTGANADASAPSGPPRAEFPTDDKIALAYSRGQDNQPLRTKNGNPYRKIVMASGHTYFLFDNKQMPIDDGKVKVALFDLFDQAKPGTPVQFIAIESKAKQGQDMWSITKVLRIGNLEWGEDGIPILRRDPPMREPGEDQERISY